MDEQAVRELVAAEIKKVEDATDARIRQLEAQLAVLRVKVKDAKKSGGEHEHVAAGRDPVHGERVTGPVARAEETTTEPPPA